MHLHILKVGLQLATEVLCSYISLLYDKIILIMFQSFVPFFRDNVVSRLKNSGLLEVVAGTIVIIRGTKQNTWTK
jgi:hypothetical protein